MGRDLPRTDDYLFSTKSGKSGAVAILEEIARRMGAAGSGEGVSHRKSEG